MGNTQSLLLLLLLLLLLKLVLCVVEDGVALPGMPSGEEEYLFFIFHLTYL